MFVCESIEGMEDGTLTATGAYVLSCLLLNCYSYPLYSLDRSH